MRVEGEGDLDGVEVGFNSCVFGSLLFLCQAMFKLIFKIFIDLNTGT